MYGHNIYSNLSGNGPFLKASIYAQDLLDFTVGAYLGDYGNCKKMRGLTVTGNWYIKMGLYVLICGRIIDRLQLKSWHKVISQPIRSKFLQQPICYKFFKMSTCLFVLTMTFSQNVTLFCAIFAHSVF